MAANKTKPTNKQTKLFNFKEGVLGEFISCFANILVAKKN